MKHTYTTNKSGTTSSNDVPCMHPLTYIQAFQSCNALIKRLVKVLHKGFGDIISTHGWDGFDRLKRWKEGEVLLDVRWESSLLLVLCGGRLICLESLLRRVWYGFHVRCFEQPLSEGESLNNILSCPPTHKRIWIVLVGSWEETSCRAQSYKVPKVLFVGISGDGLWTETENRSS